MRQNWAYGILFLSGLVLTGSDSDCDVDVDDEFIHVDSDFDDDDGFFGDLFDDKAVK